jgi:uroporphyrin-III C-methyltransferase / precorrin-2 dehydrogenase / sirohydrochlorin ferrochelatase
MSLHSLPLFVRLAGRPVILVGDGEAAAAKRRLLERASAEIVGEDADAQFAIVALEEDDEAEAVVARLRARGVLVNAVDRVALCDFTLPAIVDRNPVLIAIGSGGASAGLAKALRQRFEAMLPASLGRLAEGLLAARPLLRAKFPAPADRRRAIDAALSPGGALDPLEGRFDIQGWLGGTSMTEVDRTETLALASSDPDDLTLRQARLLGSADRVYHTHDVPPAILDRARADAARCEGDAPAAAEAGLTLIVRMAPR